MTDKLKYQIEHEGDHVAIIAYGKTRAGLFTAAMHALFEAMEPARHPENDTQNQRTFSVEAESPEKLLAYMLDDAIQVADRNGETCEDLRLNLITNTKVEGSFMGCAVTHFAKPVIGTADEGIAVTKNEETGEWEAKIRIKTRG